MLSFKSLEFDTWQRGAAAYDRLFGSVTRTAIAPSLDALELSAGERLLDLCCGTGHTVAAAHGHSDLPSPVTSPAPRLRFGEPDSCAELLLTAGFDQPVVHELPLAFALDAPETVLELAASSPRVSLLLAQQSEADRCRIEQAIVDGTLAFRQGDRIHLPIPALLTVGRKPT